MNPNYVRVCIFFFNNIVTTYTTSYIRNFENDTPISERGYRNIQTCKHFFSVRVFERFLYDTFCNSFIPPKWARSEYGTVFNTPFVAEIWCMLAEGYFFLFCVLCCNTNLRKSAQGKRRKTDPCWQELPSCCNVQRGKYLIEVISTPLHIDDPCLWAPSITAVNSFAPARYGSNFIRVIFEHMIRIQMMNILVKLLSCECHKKPLMISQHWDLYN